MNDLQTFTVMLAKSNVSFKKERVQGGSWSVEVTSLLSSRAGVFNVITEFRFTNDGELERINANEKES